MKGFCELRRDRGVGGWRKYKSNRVRGNGKAGCVQMIGFPVRACEIKTRIALMFPGI